jgi:hypothetical protein
MLPVNLITDDGYSSIGLQIPGAVKARGRLLNVNTPSMRDSLLLCTIVLNIQLL